MSRTFSFVTESSHVSCWREICYSGSSVNNVQTGSLDIVPQEEAPAEKTIASRLRVGRAHNEGIADLVFPAGRSEMSLQITSFDLDRIIVVYKRSPWSPFSAPCRRPWTSVSHENEYDSGTPFYLDTDKGCNSEDACRCANELVHELTESKKRSGRQSAAPS